MKKLDEQNDSDYIFTVMHHPYYWFEWNSKHHLLDKLIKSTDIVFFGHDHFSDSYQIEQDGKSALLQAGGELCKEGNWQNSEFYVGSLDLETREYKAIKCQWSDREQIYRTISLDPKFLSRNRKNNLGFALKDEFVEDIITDNRFLIGSDIRDYYVFPLLEEENNAGETIPRVIQDMSRMLDIIQHDEKIIIKGAGEAGKTVFSTMLFLELFNHCTPVILNRFDFNKNAINPNNPKTEKIERIIISALEREYECDESAIERYLQADTQEKAIVIDDFDFIEPIIQEEIIKYVLARYKRIVFTCQRDVNFDIKKRTRDDQLYKGFSQFIIWAFTGDKRKELIEKVACVENNDKRIQDKTIEIVVGLLTSTKLLFRWDPSFIIQLTIYVGKNASNSDRGEGNLFGDVLQSSITQLLLPAIGKIGVESRYAHGILDLIAYTAHTNEQYPFTYEIIEQAITNFNRIHKYKCPIQSFISAMVDARILHLHDDKFEFNQNSYYAFFVAREMKRKCLDEGDASVFEKTLYEAYKNVNSYIILFFTFVMDSRTLARKIMETAYECTKEWEEFDLTQPKQEYFAHIELPKVYITGNEAVEKAWKQKEDDRISNRQMELMWSNPYKEEEDREEALVTRSFSLMIVVSQMLSNLGHVLHGEDIEAIVELIYKMPLKIFNYWASSIDQNRIEVIRDIQRINSIEYRQGIADCERMSDEEALNYLRKQSALILLELMNQCIGYASRRSTFDYLDEFNHSNNIGYDIEWLMSFEKREDAKKHLTDIETVFGSCKEGLQKYLVQQVAKHFMVFSPSIDQGDRQRLNQSIFDNNIKNQHLLIESHRHSKRV